ncbi:hypothetical protein Indivirus_2_109 [Indivirus ILV1]|uniref:Uncharacterized protein n=1 Tax=Indivirus ILV1 TaxID=1977633 RepID=A0A1V0SDD1_9VIRU|nr:hypothetical protein Indivirus_2_109 [Indivirus ILV1]
MIMIYSKKSIEEANFLLDDLYIPEDPKQNSVPYGAGKFIRIIGIAPHLKMDKYNLVESIWFKPPKPNQGEKKCYRVRCKPWYQKVGCWKCE